VLLRPRLPFSPLNYCFCGSYNPLWTLLPNPCDEASIQTSASRLRRYRLTAALPLSSIRAGGTFVTGLDSSE
jgi:hypothetical protein